ncbi:MAG: hypothetical protein U9Q67_01770 [Patescibacteria group bacterium]|nr:hypothetical protein [Patescibacteria group bacterium]
MCKKKLINTIVLSFEKLVRDNLLSRLQSFYIVGSYAIGKFSIERPDINFLFIFKSDVSPKDYLTIGKICREIQEEFKSEATIKIEFRPFRCIKPMYNGKFEISINPIIVSTGEIEALGGVIVNKWMTQGLKSMNKLIFGNDYLQKLDPGVITRADLNKAAIFDLQFFTIPLSRAPAQYSKEESNLFLNESFINAKMIASLGIEAAMTKEELKNKSYIKYIMDKEKMVKFYNERYSHELASMVNKVIEIRSHYLSYKDRPEAAEEIFTIALNLAEAVKSKIFELGNK